MDARAGLIQSGYLLIAYTVHVYKRGNVQQYLAHHLSSVPCGSRGQVISDWLTTSLVCPVAVEGQVISDWFTTSLCALWQ